MDDIKKRILEAYVGGCREFRSLTSQEIADDLRHTVTLTVDEVTEFMMSRGYTPRWDDGLMTWQK